MKLFIKCEGFEGISVAAIELTEQLIETVRRRRLAHTVASVAAECTPDQMDDLRFWERAIYWYETPADAGLTDAQAEDLEPWLVSDVAAEGDDCATELDRMEIDARGVRWTCVEKHGEEPAFTVALTYDELIEAYRLSQALK